MKMLIIIPTYNESENIKTLLQEIYKVNAMLAVLVIDDNSPDRTYEIVEELMKNEYPGRLYLLKRKGKLGLGTAYIDGFKWGISNGFDCILQMDADLSHNPVYINNFIREIKNNDLVLGSRYIKGGGVKNWGIIRQIISRFGSLYSRIILGVPCTDQTGGYRCFKRETLEKIDLDTIKSEGNSFMIETIYRVWQNKMKIKEIPIIFENRTLGKSKMSQKIILEAALMVWKIKFYNRH